MKAWSISALTSFESCPRKYFEMSVAKNFVDKPSDAMAHGSAVHRAFEHFLRDGTAPPINMRMYQPIMEMFARMDGDKLVEQRLALAQTFSPTTYFAKSTWVRVVVDYAVVKGSKAVLFDFKTGKRKENMDQLALMAAVMFNHAEELEEINAMFVWLKEDWINKDWTDHVTPVKFTRDELPTMWDRFLKREGVFQDAYKNNDYPPRPGGLCRAWCPVSTCPYHGG